MEFVDGHELLDTMTDGFINELRIHTYVTNDQLLQEFAGGELIQASGRRTGITGRLRHLVGITGKVGDRRG